MDAAHPGDPVSPRLAGTPEKLRTRAGRAFLAGLQLPDDARERIEIALAMVDAIEAQIAPLERELRQLARRQTGCRALMGLYGMGELTSLVTLCELGDVQRLSASRKAVRMAGIDIGVHRSDRRARVGKLTPPRLPAAALGALRGRARSVSAQQPRPRRLPRAQGPRAQPHARVADDRAQARAPLLPRAARARPRRPGTRPDPLTTARPRSVHARHSSMTPRFRPAPAAAAAPARGRRPTKDRAAGVTPPGLTDQPSRHRPTRSRTQISPGIHGADQPYTEHNHSPPTLDTRPSSDKQQSRAAIAFHAAGRPRRP